MADYSIFPVLNATLNGTSAVLITTGRLLIGRKRVQLHRLCMIAAVVTSSLILISHTLLAAAVVPLVLLSLNYGLRSRFDRHRRISRWTFPVWLYVSITGVVVYIMLYQIY